MSNQIIKPFEETLYIEGIEEVAVDFSDIAIDELTAMVFSDVSDAMLELPVVKWATALGKTAWSIGRAVSLRNQLTFIQQLRTGEVEPDAVEKRKIALQNHEKWVEQEIETSVVYLDRYTNVKKAVYQARMYRDLLNEEITFDEYEEYLTILDQLFIGDTSYLLDAITVYIENSRDFFNSDKIDYLKEQFDSVHCGRMQSLGLLEGIITSRVGSARVERYAPTDQGIYFYSVLREENDMKHKKIVFKKYASVK